MTGKNLGMTNENPRRNLGNVGIYELRERTFVVSLRTEYR